MKETAYTEPKFHKISRYVVHFNDEMEHINPGVRRKNNRKATVQWILGSKEKGFLKIWFPKSKVAV